MTVCKFIEAVWEGFSAEVTSELRMKDKGSRPLGCVGWNGGVHPAGSRAGAGAGVEAGFCLLFEQGNWCGQYTELLLPNKLWKK